MAATAGKKGFIKALPGDKMVWIIVLMLCLISLVSIFSSTSQLAAQNHVSRLNIAMEQFWTIAAGIALIFGCCIFKRVDTFRNVSKFGFLLSLCLLIPVAAKVDWPFLSAPLYNGARRTLVIFGQSISIFEFVKVFMVMYTAWAVDHLQKDRIMWLERLSRKKRMGWINQPFWAEVIYLLLPAAIVGVLTLKGSTSSALLIVGVMFMTMLLGRINFFHLVAMGIMAMLVFGACFGLYNITKHSEHPLFERIGTAVSRSKTGTKEYVELALAAKDKNEYYKNIDKVRQPYGAKIAIKEGGFLGKGPGQSTQKYKVSIIYEDFIFSFIIEEYGIIMAGLVLILYISLLARGALIIKNCRNSFARYAVAGLCLLISGQAMFHIIINCDINVLTGQTLPLISHGKTSFLCFCVAFGIIISISRMAEKRLADEMKHAESLLDMNDDVRNSMNDLDAMDSTD